MKVTELVAGVGYIYVLFGKGSGSASLSTGTPRHSLSLIVSSLQDLCWAISACLLQCKSVVKEVALSNGDENIIHLGFLKAFNKAPPKGSVVSKWLKIKNGEYE